MTILPQRTVSEFEAAPRADGGYDARESSSAQSVRDFSTDGTPNAPRSRGRNSDGDPGESFSNWLQLLTGQPLLETTRPGAIGDAATLTSQPVTTPANASTEVLVSVGQIETRSSSAAPLRFAPTGDASERGIADIVGPLANGQDPRVIQHDANTTLFTSAAITDRSRTVGELHADATEARVTPFTETPAAMTSESMLRQPSTAASPLTAESAIVSSVATDETGSLQLQADNAGYSQTTFGFEPDTSDVRVLLDRVTLADRVANGLPLAESSIRGESGVGPQLSLSNASVVAGGQPPTVRDGDAADDDAGEGQPAGEFAELLGAESAARATAVAHHAAQTGPRDFADADTPRGDANSAHVESGTALDTQRLAAAPVDDRTVYAQRHDAYRTHEPPPVARQIADNIIGHAEVRERGGRTEFYMRLEPPELGSVRIHLSASEHGVTARLMVADESVRQLVESQLGSLRDSLAEAGLTLHRFDVSQDGLNGAFRHWQQQDMWRPLIADVRQELRTPRVAPLPRVHEIAARVGRVDVVV
jgi:hypothetical protein